jgi:hypothetical protein
MFTPSHVDVADQAKSQGTETGNRVMFTATIRAAHRALPLAAIGLAVAIKAIWIGALGYGIWAFF